MKKAELAIASVVLAVVILIALDAMGRMPGTSPGPPQAQKAPDFTLKDIYGHEFSLSDYRGKVVILDFFMIRCAPCGAQVAELKKVLNEYGGQVVIISISVDPGDTVEALRDYASQNGITWTVAKDTANLADKYDVRAVPTLVIIDQDGYIRYRHVGLTSGEQLIEEVGELLGS